MDWRSTLVPESIAPSLLSVGASVQGEPRQHIRVRELRWYYCGPTRERSQDHSTIKCGGVARFEAQRNGSTTEEALPLSKNEREGPEPDHGNGLERHLRDAQTLRHHGLVSAERSETVGQAFLGVPPEFPMVHF
jgi:hypothetical protein